MKRSFLVLSAITLTFVALRMVIPAGIHQPEPPTDIAATAVDSGVELRWTPSVSPELAGYYVYRSVVSSNGDPAVRINDAVIEGSAFMDTDVLPGVFFCYTVRAVTVFELESLDSTEACASFQANAFGLFKRGDADGNGTLQITDSIFTLRHLFTGQDHPQCLDALDFDDSGLVNLSDAVASLEYQFRGGAAPPPPGAYDCGFDPIEDGIELGCSFHICESEGT